MPTADGAPKRALVTGASGFIGTRLVQRLRALGTHVVAIDIAPPRLRLLGVEYRQLDVRERLPPDLHGGGISSIYNLAAIHRTPGHPTEEYYETNVLGAINVTAFAEAYAILNIVFTSSISVYGPSEKLMTEQSPLHPTTAYGRSKRLAEIIHRSWYERAPNRRLTIVRPGVVFGPGERGNYTNLARALSRGFFFYPGRTTTVKSGGYVDDLIGTLEFADLHPDRLSLYNFAYPDPSTTEDIISAFANVSRFKRRYATVPVAPLYVAAGIFEFANSLGIHNPIHRQRVLKLVQSTRIEPAWLKASGYAFQYDLEGALRAWSAETDGSFA